MYKYLISSLNCFKLQLILVVFSGWLGYFDIHSCNRGQFHWFWRLLQRPITRKISHALGISCLISTWNIYTSWWGKSWGFCWKFGPEQFVEHFGFIFWRRHWQTWCMFTWYCSLHQCPDCLPASCTSISQVAGSSEKRRWSRKKESSAVYSICFGWVCSSPG